MPTGHCPLCHHTQLMLYHQDRLRDYWQCARCQLVFVPAAYQLSLAQEKAVYDQHQNNPQDAGYRRFLSRLAEPLANRLSRGDRGLDYGAGPGPTLSLMLSEQGFPTLAYDPIYAPEHELLERQYAFIACSEAIEHFYQPSREWARWLDMLRPGGWLGIMTKRVTGPEAFSRWHYKNDPTHVCFFSEQTFHFLAKRDGLTVEFVSPDVVLLQMLQKKQAVADKG